MTIKPPPVKPARPEDKCVVGLAPLPNGEKMVVLLLSPEAYAYMEGQQGYSHQFDLTRWGVPLKIMMGRCDSRAAGIKMLTDFTLAQGAAASYRPGDDLSIQPPKDPAKDE